MPESCIEKYMCGTNAPLWMASPHPALSDGIVSRDVCGHWGDSCCLIQSNPIHVKACPGNYFVYKFVDIVGCYLAYCADVNTTVCGTCSAHEKCVTDDQVSWRCEREEGVLPAPQVVCGRDLLQVGLNKAALVDAGLDVSTAHLADLSCGVNHQSNSMVWFQVQPREGVCATQMRVNDTHATYSNAIFVYEGNQSFSNPESFPFSCVYSLLAETSVDLGIRPELNMEGGVVGTGAKAMPSISLYRNADYTDPYSAGLIVLALGTALHVGVSVQEAGATGFAVILEECYATPSADSDDPERFFLIQNRCPSDRLRCEHVRPQTALLLPEMPVQGGPVSLLREAPDHRTHLLGEGSRIGLPSTHRKAKSIGPHLNMTLRSSGFCPL
ncbi:hypothetical protein AGOR_G00196940 [Albula goreensis]|uniref:ZP domain-containing protein n=1 Tax=Albula goreensis TaxID=1534307 RepID=A0A8T3CN33_9TELE|nr:hypothetical protein AGOR_G00196940 [Albula goreensis]